MTQPLSLQVTTHVFGLGDTRATEPIFIFIAIAPSSTLSYISSRSSLSTLPSSS